MRRSAAPAVFAVSVASPLLPARALHDAVSAGVCAALLLLAPVGAALGLARQHAAVCIAALHVSLWAVHVALSRALCAAAIMHVAVFVNVHYPVGCVACHALAVIASWGRRVVPATLFFLVPYRRRRAFNALACFRVYAAFLNRVEFQALPAASA